MTIQSGNTSITKRRQRFANLLPPPPFQNAVLVTDGSRQSFYVTLDISSAADHNKLRTKKKKLDPSLPTFPQPATSPGPQEDRGPSEPVENPVPETSVPMDIDPALEQPEEDTPSSEPENRIQILDLHTYNPLISYKNKLYSCKWTSTLGTDVILTSPTPDFSHPILREKPGVSILAASSIKLMGRPAHLTSRHGAKEGHETSTAAPENSLPSTNTADPEQAIPIKIPLGATPSRARQNQANFLERLMAIKAKKGEKDNVTVYTQKVNQGTGWRSQRKAAEALEEGEEETTPKRGKGSIGRPMGSKRLRGPRTAKGGLFRDYRPQLWDTPGADIRAGSSFTPERWDQLESGASEERQTSATATARASPYPADYAAQARNESTRSLSTSASTTAPPTPLSKPVQSADNQTNSTAELPAPSASPAQSSEVQPTPVTQEAEGPSPEEPYPETLQQTQAQGSIEQRSTPAPHAAIDNLEKSGTAVTDDAEMLDV